MKETRFKDTEIGRIPEEWEVKFVGDICPTLKTGKLDANAMVPNGTYRFYTCAKDFYKIDKYAFDGEALLISGNGENVGYVHYYKGKFNAYQRTYVLMDLLEDYRFTQFYLLKFLRERINVEKSNSATPYIKKDTITDMLVGFPSIAEQTRIASALTSIDNLLSSLEKLITKKKDIKQGTMQQLLTGKKRLKGFTEPWVEKSLNSVFEFKKGNGLSKEKIVSDGINFCMLYGEIFTRFNYVTKGDFYRTNYSEGTPSKKDDILMPGSTTTNGFDLVKAVAIDTEGVRLGGDIIILRKRKNDVNAYFWASLISEIEKQKIADKTQGITIIHLHAKNLIDIKYRVPSTCEEQTAIASVLTAMDNEIAALEAKRAKYESIKQGMMQQLLTGKIRLVETAAKTNTITANVHFRRSVLAAEIADRLCDEPTFGHVKMEKMLFLTERLCDINIGSHYHRDAAGPYDNNALRSIDSQLKRQKWFEVQQTEKGYKYVAMPNRGKHKTYFDKYYSNVLPMFDKIINTFKTQRTEQCEIVATLYSAWEDLIHKNQPFTDADIVNEVLNNWHESKKRISRDRWQESIQWMRNNGFAPNSTSI